MTIEFWEWLRGLVLLGVANGAPVVGSWLLRRRFDYALDGGVNFLDGRRLFGPNKTIRGVSLSLVATAALAPLFGLSWQGGALFAAAAMAGDLLSSFTKRRLWMTPGSMALGLDQVPESLLPLLFCRVALGLDYFEVAALVVAFFVMELLASRLLYRLRVRERPY